MSSDTLRWVETIQKLNLEILPQHGRRRDLGTVLSWDQGIFISRISYAQSTWRGCMDANPLPCQTPERSGGLCNRAKLICWQNRSMCENMSWRNPVPKSIRDILFMVKGSWGGAAIAVRGGSDIIRPYEPQSQLALILDAYDFQMSPRDFFPLRA